MHNYQSLMTLFLALNMRSTGKLSQTWKGLKPKTYTMWKRICTLMSPKDNFNHYRDALKMVDLPFIPCQEIVLKDLLYHDEATPDFLEEGVWNLKKLYVIGKNLDQFRRCQEHPYLFTPLLELQEFLTQIRTDITTAELDALCARIESPTTSSNNNTTNNNNTNNNTNYTNTNYTNTNNNTNNTNTNSTTSNTSMSSSTSGTNFPRTQRSEKTEPTPTDSETTDDADSSVGTSVGSASATLARSSSSRVRSGSVGSEYSLKRRTSFDSKSLKKYSVETTKISVIDGKKGKKRPIIKALQIEASEDEGESLRLSFTDRKMRSHGEENTIDPETVSVIEKNDKKRKK